jgi:hypothetical protein
MTAREQEASGLRLICHARHPRNDHACLREVDVGALDFVFTMLADPAGP